MKICEVRNGFFDAITTVIFLLLCLVLFAFVTIFFMILSIYLFLDVNCWRLVIFGQRWKDVRSRRIEKVKMQCSEISIEKMSKIFSINHIQYVDRKRILNFQVLFLFLSLFISRDVHSGTVIVTESEIVRQISAPLMRSLSQNCPWDRNESVFSALYGSKCQNILSLNVATSLRKKILHSKST